jgi:hypothetical protein
LFKGTPRAVPDSNTGTEGVRSKYYRWILKKAIAYAVLQP